MNKMNKVYGLIAMTVVVCIYGVSYIAREAIGGALTAAQIVSMQMTIMMLFFGVYNLLAKKSFTIHKQDLIWIISAGLFGTTFFHGFTLLSVNSLGATVSSLLYGFAAALALIFEIILYHRKKTVLGFFSARCDKSWPLLCIFAISCTDFSSDNASVFCLRPFV